MRKNENIIWHPGKVTKEDRQQLLGQQGLVVWFTGLSGSGKSTIAVEVEKKLIESGHPAYVLDGDNIRHGLNADLGFCEEDRNENIRRISEVAALFADAGMITLVSFISPFRKMREFARERAGSDNFIEIYVSTDFATCKKRDPKGLYKKDIKNFTGKDSLYEKPLAAELTIDTAGKMPDECANVVYEAILEKMNTQGDE